MRNLFIYILFAIIVCYFSFSACNQETVLYTRFYADGSQLYKLHCENCHGDKGEGLVNLIPPLTDTLYLRKNRSTLACMVRYGLNSELIVNNKKFKFAMPANTEIAPIDMAKLLTYVTNSFGNKQGIFEVADVENNLGNCQ